MDEEQAHRPRSRALGGGSPATRVSIVMPVRNALPYLDAAVESIVGQTFRDFEFVIVDDGSTDGSWERLRTWAERDRRIMLSRSPFAPGPVSSSNHAVSLAREPLVARMDADDLAHPERIERQVKAMEAAADAVLIGCLWEGMDRDGRTVYPADPSLLARRKPRAPFCHGSILFRREAFDRAGGYRPACAYWEDIDLYFRMARQGRILVLPDTLYRHRFSQTSGRLNALEEEVERAVDLRFRCCELIDRGLSYEPVLEAGARPAGERVSMRVFAALSGIRIWAGVRPAILLRALKRGRRPRSVLEWLSFAYLVLGTIHPRMLRAMLRSLGRIRRRQAGRGEWSGHPVEWHWSLRHIGLRPPNPTAPQAGDRPA